MTRIGTLSAALVLGLGALAGCSGGGSGSDEDPTAVLERAAELLAESGGAHLSLTTDDFPSGATGVVSAVGDTTDAPAFEGDLVVRMMGQDFQVPVVAVDDKVWARIPLTVGWSDIDPAEYDAPDPAQLMTEENGVGALLEATEDPVAGDSVRGGEDNTQVLTSYSGTIDGEVMKRVIPTSAGDSYDMTYLVDDDGYLQEVEMTGVFYSGSDEMTYSLVITDYGLDRTIQKP